MMTALFLEKDQQYHSKRKEKVYRLCDMTLAMIEPFEPK
jgi:hypothetical protein